MPDDCLTPPIAEVAGRELAHFPFGKHVQHAELTVPPKLVVIDIDHTLIADNQILSAETIAAIAEVQGAGIDVMLASARPPRGVWPFASRLEMFSPRKFVALQGGMCGSYTENGALTIDFEEPIPLDIARDLIGSAAEIGVIASWYRGEHWFVSGVDAAIEHDAAVVQMNPELGDIVDDLVGPDKILFISTPSTEVHIQALVSSLSASLKATRSNPTFVEITRAGVDKASAVRRCAILAGIHADEIVAIGDGENDLTLFEFAGTSVAPANAASSVLAAATFVTESNNDHGVAVALRSLLLQT